MYIVTVLTIVDENGKPTVSYRGEDRGIALRIVEWYIQQGRFVTLEETKEDK